MAETLGVVQIPERSVLCPLRRDRRLGGRTLVEWVVRRTSESQQLDRVIVVAPLAVADGELARLLPEDVHVVYSNCNDSLGQLHEVAKQFDAHAIVRVRADSPFVDPLLIDRLVCRAAKGGLDYLGYSSRDGRPAARTPLGIFAEWFSAAAIAVAEGRTVDPMYREQIADFFLANPGRFCLGLLPVPESLDRDDVRLTLEQCEDWDHAQTIVETLGTDQLDWNKIANLLIAQPRLRARMAELNRSAAA